MAAAWDMYSARFFIPVETPRKSSNGCVQFWRGSMSGAFATIGTLDEWLGAVRRDACDRRL